MKECNHDWWVNRQGRKDNYKCSKCGAEKVLNEPEEGQDDDSFNLKNYSV